jgi:hypothetical protein
MCNGPDGYDACLRIAHLDWLAHRLYHRAIIPSLGDIPVSDIFAKPEIRKVSYEKLVRTIHDGPMLCPGPFVRDIAFAAQREIRILFRPLRKLDQETLIIKFPRPHQLFSLEFSQLSPAQLSSAEAFSKRTASKI